MFSLHQLKTALWSAIVSVAAKKSTMVYFMTAQSFQFFMIVEIFRYNLIIQRNSNILCKPFAFEFWLTMSTYLIFLRLLTVPFLWHIYVNSRRPNWYLGLAILINFLEFLFIMYTLIRIDLLDFKGTIIRESESSNVFFTILTHEFWFDPEASPIFIDTEPFQVDKFNPTKSGRIPETSDRCLWVKSSQLCHAWRPSVLREESSILICFRPSNMGLEILKSHFDPMKINSIVIMMLALFYLSFMYQLMYGILCKTIHQLNQRNEN